MKKALAGKVVTALTAAFVFSSAVGEAFAEDAFVNKLSDADFEEALLSNEGIAIPVYLGCNRGPKLEPELPIRCRLEGTEIQVSELRYSGLSLGASLAKVEDTSGWVDLVLAVDAFESSKTFTWSVEPRMIWVSQTDGRTVLCLLGQPSDPSALKGFEIYQAADCITLSHSSGDPSQERTLRVKFFDTGKMNSLLSFDQTDPAEFQSTITFFMHRAFAVPGFGSQE